MAENEKKTLAFAQFIEDNGPWDLWLTVTFRKKTQLSGAKKSFKRFIKNINSKDSLFTNCVFCFTFFEKDERGGVHIHAVLRGIHPLHAPEIGMLCKKYFGQSKVVPHFSCKNAIFYLADKFGSSDLEHYDLMKINTNRSCMTQSQTTWSCFRVSECYTNLFPNLVDEDYETGIGQAVFSNLHV